ncbi:hypothetical protein B0H19DRAFT_1247576 [Mycena capillaripes]|nr:hypothetical protein B0H19DRAFT_1247576 [Mycena capillaripes]
MQVPREDLAHRKTTPSSWRSSDFDGSDPSKPTYVSVKDTLSDVAAKADIYGSGKAYNIFAGSKGLEMSSLKEEYAIPTT